MAAGTPDSQISKPLAWFKHPSNLRTDPRVGRMRARWGARGYCWLIDTLEILAANGGTIEGRGVAEYLAYELDEALPDDVSEWLSCCQDCGLLVVAALVASPLLDDSLSHAKSMVDRGKAGAQAVLRRSSSPPQAELEQHSGDAQAETRARAHSHSSSNSGSSSSFLSQEGVQSESNHVQIDDISREALEVNHGREVVAEAIEIANAHVEMARGTHEFASLVKRARNGSAFLRKWPIEEATKRIAARSRPRSGQSSNQHKREQDMLDSLARIENGEVV